MDKKGSSNIETIMTMTLLILFSAAIFTLMYVGNDTEKRILDQNAIKSNARVASSYINVKLKQNDVSGKISVKVNPNTASNALVITDISSKEKKNTWIYFEDGYLLESTTEELAPDNDTAFQIAKIDDFQIDKENDTITTRIKYFYNNEMQKVTSIIVLRSEN